MNAASSCQKIRLIVRDTTEDAELEAARVIKRFIAGQPSPVLGLATGRTMVPVYAWLTKWHRGNGLSFSGCTSFNLDEYRDLDPDHASSFTSYMRRHLFDHVDMRPGNWHMPNPAEPGEAYETLIRQHDGIGLQLLGIGRNGHIGFNEPGAQRESRTRIVKLAETTRRANERDFPTGDIVPTHAVTMGIATILDAQEIVLLATGAAKAEALQRTVHGPVTTDCPGSFLQLHNRVTIVCDRAAAAMTEDNS